MGIGKAIAAMVLGTCVLHGLPQTRRPASKPHQAAPAQERQADDLKEAEDLLQKEQYPQAESLLQTYVSKQTENPQAWFDLGFAQGRLGKNSDAILAYKRAVALSPKWFEAQQNLGLALAKSGDLPAAASAL